MRPTSATGDPVRPSPHQPPARRHAFTLMELMVVILVVTILTAMIIPELRGSFEEALLRSSARRLAGACDVAYSRAVAAGRSQRLRFEPSTGRYRVEARAHAPKSDAAPTEVPDAAGTIDPRITVVLRHADAPAPATAAVPDPESAGGEGIGFNADGTADAAEFELSDRGGFRLVVRVNPITARIRVIDPGRP